MVLQPSEPRITITGVERLTRQAVDFGEAAGGVALFQELHIVSTVTRADANGDDERMSTQRPGSEKKQVPSYCRMVWGGGGVHYS